MMGKNYSGPERRESVRLNQLIPVEFSLISDEQVAEVYGKRKGIIQNISAGGVRLEIEGLEEVLFERLKNGMIKLGLFIPLPPNTEAPLRILAQVCWISLSVAVSPSGKPSYVIGCKFIDITTVNQDVIREYVTKFFLEHGSYG